jgi:hypothetical protein
VETVFSDKKEFTEYMKTQNNEIETIWKTRILMENYSRGNIIMFYDAYKLGFSYYCDQNVVSYDILNAIAMKYVMTYQCLPFFIDETVLPEDYNLELKIHYVEDKKEKRSVDVNHSFAKLRNYNATTSTTNTIHGALAVSALSTAGLVVNNGSGLMTSITSTSSAATSSNFSAAKYITVSISGTNYYIPCETSTW